MSENKYLALKKRQQEEINNFPMFFAFGTSQLYDGMRKLGLQPTQTNEVVNLGGGCFVRKTDEKRLNQMMARHENELKDAIKSDKTGEGFIYHMFRYELANHEYGYTCDVSDTLVALGIGQQDILNNQNLKRGLELATTAIRSEN